MKEEIITKAIPGGFASLATAFVIESIEHMLPWLMVAFMVIVCDLICGIRKSMLMGERVRFSSAVRRTMGKMVTYFAFVVMVCMITVAAGGIWKIDIYSCLLVCLIEGISIVGNILKPKGYDIDLRKVLNLFGRKALKMDDDLSDCVKETRNEEPKNQI